MTSILETVEKFLAFSDEKLAELEEKNQSLKLERQEEK